MTCRACLRRILQSKAELHTPITGLRSCTTIPVVPSPRLIRSFTTAGPSRPTPVHQFRVPITTPPQHHQVRRIGTTPTFSNLSSPRQSRRHSTNHLLTTLPRAATALSPRSDQIRTFATVIPHSIKDPIPSSSSNATPIKVTAPSLEAIKEEGYLDEDISLIPPEQATIKLTPQAVSQLVKITSRESPDVLKEGKLALRVGVESGGCHGYQYTMAITEERGVDDYIMQPEGVECIPVVVDIVSLGLLKGATLTFTTELIGSSFQIESNPQAKQGGNCGCGVSWELEAPAPK